MDVHANDFTIENLKVYLITQSTREIPFPAWVIFVYYYDGK